MFLFLICSIGSAAPGLGADESIAGDPPGKQGAPGLRFHE